eukprot:gnl/Dysnectes_brevis/1701_a1934_2871.p1 GENE.gnl/Dysnectes_brevis/1701_a1934_2871~~gnl/Dysnectes_brevis/1701_a1934_2871.p1  ORF type:complete len:739 (-),score=212.09 gnl/Dysnectes_brevis/1701_a1934_2871:68-2182(-)
MSVVRYESVIHEYDPFFAYRSTLYLVKNGLDALLNWFDDISWYPVGRIVGSTLYPGMMVTAGVFYKILDFIGLHTNVKDVCVFVGPFMAANATLIAYWTGCQLKNKGVGLYAAIFTAVVPGFVQRSVAGSFDNESVSITALILCFALWIKASNTGGVIWSVLAAVQYFYMAAAWGAYVFVANLVPLHLFALFVCRKATPQSIRAYMVFYSVGTFLSMQLRQIHWIPLTASIHFPGLAIFLLCWVVLAVRWIRRTIGDKRAVELRRPAVIALSSATLVAIPFLMHVGFIASLGGRLYSFVNPTYAKKYKPIVASVSEHQPTTWASFFFDLHLIPLLIPLGLWEALKDASSPSIFVICYMVCSIWFSGVMSRMILVLAPIAALVGALALESLISSSLPVVFEYVNNIVKAMKGIEEAATPKKTVTTTVPSKKTKKKGKKGKKGKKTTPEKQRVNLAQAVIALCGLALTVYFTLSFLKHALWTATEVYSSPSVVMAGRRADGSMYVIDDYREAYSWLEHNTPESAKIISWWDYGYQLSQMSNRTTLVDNNTWNNTMLAMAGAVLASTEDVSWRICRLLDADYVLVVFGGILGQSSDDINKFLWPIRISNAKHFEDRWDWFPAVTESEYYNSQGQYKIDSSAPERMTSSTLYKMCYYRFHELFGAGQAMDRVRNQEPQRVAQLDYFEEVFTSEHWLVRVYRLKDPANF